MPKKGMGKMTQRVRSIIVQTCMRVLGLLVVPRKGMGKVVQEGGLLIDRNPNMAGFDCRLRLLTISWLQRTHHSTYTFTYVVLLVLP